MSTNIPHKVNPELMVLAGDNGSGRAVPLLLGPAGVISQGAGLPYGADNMVITNVAAGPATITYKRGATTLKTRTLTYTNAGASADDVLTSIVDS